MSLLCTYSPGDSTRVYLFWEPGRGATLEHAGLEYPPERFCTGASFAEDAQNVLEGHFRALGTPSRSGRGQPLAARSEGMTAVFCDPPPELEAYVGVSSREG